MFTSPELLILCHNCVFHSSPIYFNNPPPSQTTIHLCCSPPSPPIISITLVWNGESDFHVVVLCWSFSLLLSLSLKHNTFFLLSNTTAQFAVKWWNHHHLLLLPLSTLLSTFSNAEQPQVYHLQASVRHIPSGCTQRQARFRERKPRGPWCWLSTRPSALLMEVQCGVFTQRCSGGGRTRPRPSLPSMFPPSLPRLVPSSGKIIFPSLMPCRACAVFTRVALTTIRVRT